MSATQKPLLILLMGVAGSGKTTVGDLLARTLGHRFIDADTLHPRANIVKMRQGVPLNDADRGPWLDQVAGLLRLLVKRQEPAVLACSALKRRYREQLRAAAPGLVLVHLQGPAGLIRARMEKRAGHFFDPRLLASQFADLEVPDDGMVVDVSRDPVAIVALICDRIGLKAAQPGKRNQQPRIWSSEDPEK